MSIFARVDHDNLVVHVHVVADDEAEPRALLVGLWGGSESDYIPAPNNDEPGYPGNGWRYDPDLDVFVPPAAPVEP